MSLFEAVFEGKDVAVVLAATDLLSEDTVVTLWMRSDKLYISVPAKSSTRTFVLSIGSQVTVLATEELPNTAYRPATMKLSAFQHVMGQKGECLRVSLDPEEHCLVVAGMKSVAGNKQCPEHIRSAEITPMATA